MRSANRGVQLYNAAALPLPDQAIGSLRVEVVGRVLRRYLRAGVGFGRVPLVLAAPWYVARRLTRCFLSASAAKVVQAQPKVREPKGPFPASADCPGQDA
jgi:hypothetical protein